MTCPVELLRNGIRHRVVFALLLFGPATVGCEAAWNLLNRGDLKRDVLEVARRSGVTLADPICNMMGTTRSGRCEGRASVEQVASLVRGLALREIGDRTTGREGSAAWAWESEPGGCRSLQTFGEGPPVRVYASQRRADTLRMRHGGAFEYFLLFHPPGTDAVCIQVSYAYG